MPPQLIHFCLIPLSRPAGDECGVPGAELFWLDAAHLSNRERPAEFANCVMGFLGSGLID